MRARRGGRPRGPAAGRTTRADRPAPAPGTDRTRPPAPERAATAEHLAAPADRAPAGPAPSERPTATVVGRRRVVLETAATAVAPGTAARVAGPDAVARAAGPETVGRTAVARETAAMTAARGRVARVAGRPAMVAVSGWSCSDRTCRRCRRSAGRRSRGGGSGRCPVAARRQAGRRSSKASPGQLFRYSGDGGAGTSALKWPFSHVAYEFAQLPSDRICFSTPLTKPTKSVLAFGNAKPYGSGAMLRPTILVFVSCATMPARIVSSVDTASTSPCWSITRQSDQSLTATGIGASGWPWFVPNESEPVLAQIFLPPSWLMSVTFDELGTSTLRLAW